MAMRAWTMTIKWLTEAVRTVARAFRRISPWNQPPRLTWTVVEGYKTKYGGYNRRLLRLFDDGTQEVAYFDNRPTVTIEVTPRRTALIFQRGKSRILTVWTGRKVQPKGGGIVPLC